MKYGVSKKASRMGGKPFRIFMSRSCPVLGNPLTPDISDDTIIVK